MNIATALKQGAQLLEDHRISAPRLTAEVLLAHAIGCDRTWLYAHATDELKELWWIHYGRYLHERTEGKPTQYITKKQEFYGREFRVGPEVLIPRPETEHVVERGIHHHSGGRIIDAGTGSGAIAASLALETQAPVAATDISLAALQLAAFNAHRLSAVVGFVCCDLLSAFPAESAAMIVSNPPYVPRRESGVLQREVVDYEPHVALFGGDDGFEIYGRLIEDAHRVLNPGGWLIMETAYNAEERVRAMLAPRWNQIEVHRDLAGLPRVIEARKQG